MEWHPTRFFHHSNKSPYALIILNQPINENAFVILRKHASLVVCADGGANRYYDLMKAHGRESIDLPDAVIGDLDSIKSTTRSHYERLRVPVIQDPDQYSTDFTKCLKHLRDWYYHGGLNGDDSASIDIKDGSGDKYNNRTLEILILGGLGGRVDQAFSQIHHLTTFSMKWSGIHTSTTIESESAPKTDANDNNNGNGNNTDLKLNLYLISEESITFILHPGKNIIHTPGTNRPLEEEERKKNKNNNNNQEYFLEENVGIIPYLGPTRITTHGFEWDVTHWPTQIGGQISTSNHIRADVVEVDCEASVLFTLELATRFKFWGSGR